MYNNATIKNNQNSDHNLTAGARRNGRATTAAVLLLLSGIFLQGQAGACPLTVDTAPTQPTKAVAHSAQKEAGQVNPAYYQSSDNPYRAD